MFETQLTFSLPDPCHTYSIFVSLVEKKTIRGTPKSFQSCVIKMKYTVPIESARDLSKPVPFQTGSGIGCKNNRKNNDTIAMSLKTIEATRQENESKYRSGRGTCLLEQGFHWSAENEE